MKIFITGFKPFLNESMNPSEKIVQQFENSNEDIRTLVLPVEFKRSFEILKAEINKNIPDYLVMLGQASGRKNICLEKVALNWVQTEHADENRQAPMTGPILAGEPVARMSPCPIDLIIKKLKEKGILVELSFSAGAFVCNDLYYRVLSEFPNVKAVFIHLPLVTEQLQAGDLRPALSLQHELNIIRTIVELIVRDDLAIKD